MAVFTFPTNHRLTNGDINTFLANSGVVYLAEQSATSGTEMTVSNCFTSAYANYKVVISDVRWSFNTVLLLRLVDSSGNPAINDYRHAFVSVPYSGTATPAVSASGTAAAVWLTVPMWAGATNNSGGCVLDVMNPQRTVPTAFRAEAYEPLTTGSARGPMTGVHSQSSAYTGFRLTGFLSPTITNLTVRVYGVRVA